MRNTLRVVVTMLLAALVAAAADEDTAALIQRARAVRLNGHPDQALAILEPLISKGSSSGVVVDEYVMSVCGRLRGDELRAKIDELEKRFGVVAAIHVERAELASEASDVEALAEIERGLEAFPDNESLAALKGYYLVDKSPEEAIAWLLEAAKKYPTSEVVQNELGWAYDYTEASEENSAKALAAYQRATELNPGWTDPLNAMAQLQVRNGDYEAALGTVARAEKIDPERLDVKRCKLQAVSMVEKPPTTPEDVWREIDSILDKKGRELVDLRRALHIANSREIRDQQRAEALRDEIIKRFPDSPDAASMRRMGKVEAATKLLSEGKQAEAEPLLRQAIAEAKEQREKVWMYDILARAVQDDRAKLVPVLDEYAAALQNSPSSGHLQAPLKLARFYTSVGEYDKAILWVQRGRESFGGPKAQPGLPADVRTMLEREADSILADAYVKAGRAREAKTVLNRLLEDKDWAAEAHERLGQIATQEKDWAAAESHLETAFRQTFLGKDVETDLKALYVARTGSENGWDDYITALRKSASGDLRSEVVKMYSIEPKPVPTFELSVLGGERKASNKETADKVVVLSLWATWCKPCVQELPEFQKFYDKHSKDARLSIWSINAGEPPSRVQKFLQGKPFTFPVLLDPDAFDRFGVDGIPATLVADASGRIRFHMTGYNPDVDYVQLVEWLLESASAQGGSRQSRRACESMPGSTNNGVGTPGCRRAAVPCPPDLISARMMRRRVICALRGGVHVLRVPEMRVRDSGY
ncbi:MAG: redoxin domain-containing protein [Acidobacteriota bacterium]